MHSPFICSTVIREWLWKKTQIENTDNNLNINNNNNNNNNAFSDSAKLAPVRPIYKKDYRNEITNYRHFNILNYFWRIYEQFLNKQLLPFVNRSIYELMSACRYSRYSTNHVLIQLSENWRNALDNNLFTVTFLMDLSKCLTVFLTIS